MWLTGEDSGGMLIVAETDTDGRLAISGADLVVSLDVTVWCPDSGRSTDWPDANMLQAQSHVRAEIAEKLGWQIINHDDLDY